MDLSDPETWRWIWLVLAVVFAVGEIAVAGSFFLAPFAVGAAVASVLGFAGLDLAPQWLAFVVVSGALLAGMRPLAHRLDQSGHVPGVGSSRQVGQSARVLEAIDGPHDQGLVLFSGERWRAESADGSPIPVGATVLITEVRGTRVIVTPTTDATPEPTA
ncbi:MAG: NfeD family protein [Acidimicrobiales bacterium]|nr:NfeD family protein [Acidimicrobiales bacterium]HRW37269.1 NfeD family protein [Aquihabitans sp.]